MVSAVSCRKREENYRNKKGKNLEDIYLSLAVTHQKSLIMPTIHQAQEEREEEERERRRRKREREEEEEQRERRKRRGRRYIQEGDEGKKKKRIHCMLW